jgi:hypothetical protein
MSEPTYVTGRPEGMEYDEYKKWLAIQNKFIKQYLKGHVVYPTPKGTMPYVKPKKQTK